MLGISCEMLEVYEMLCECKLMHVYEETLCLDQKKDVCMFLLGSIYISIYLYFYKYVYIS